MRLQHGGELVASGGDESAGALITSRDPVAIGIAVDAAERALGIDRARRCDGLDPAGAMLLSSASVSARQACSASASVRMPRFAQLRHEGEEHARRGHRRRQAPNADRRSRRRARRQGCRASSRRGRGSATSARSRVSSVRGGCQATPARSHSRLSTARSNPTEWPITTALADAARQAPARRRRNRGASATRRVVDAVNARSAARGSARPGWTRRRHGAVRHRAVRRRSRTAAISTMRALAGVEPGRLGVDDDRVRARSAAWHCRWRPSISLRPTAPRDEFSSRGPVSSWHERSAHPCACSARHGCCTSSPADSCGWPESRAPRSFSWIGIRSK